MENKGSKETRKDSDKKEEIKRAIRKRNKIIKDNKIIFKDEHSKIRHQERTL